MKCTPHHTIPEIVIIELDVFRDARGHFQESYHCRRYQEHGYRHASSRTIFPSRSGASSAGCTTNLESLRASWSRSSRARSSTLPWTSDAALPPLGNGSDDSLRRYVYPGLHSSRFRSRFCVLSESALFAYKCTDYYAPKEERGIRWDDSTLNIQWPISDPIVSKKDGDYPGLANVSSAHLRYLLLTPID